jgi:pimeloyl-ACP methyl ester carboxylesterase
VKLLLVTSLTLTLLAAPADATTTPGIAWGACTDPQLAAAGAECGTLDVPLNHADPAGRKITLAVSRVRHKTAESKATVLTVPDALTGSGYRQSLLGARLPSGAAFDWVGFARRGLSPSVPAISCPADHFAFNRPDYVPSMPAIEADWLSRSQTFAEQCATTQRDLLDHMKTADMAADMDLVRAALGVPKVLLYGQSYGTYLSSVYATRYPHRVARMVLDSNVDPRRVWYNAANFDVNPGLDRNLRIWFGWLAERDSVYHLGATTEAVQQVWDEQLRRIAIAPADGVIGRPEWIDLFLFVPYSRQTWPLLGSAFSGWVNNGDGATLRALFSQFYLTGNGNTYGAQLAQLCTDTAWPASWSTWRADSWASHAIAPVTTWGNTWFTAPCLFWRAKPGKPVQVGGFGSALLVGETLDAPTPFEGSLEVRSRFPRSALLAVDGGVNHAATLTGNSCVDSAIDAYLTSGTLPARKPGRQADATCAA